MPELILIDAYHNEQDAVSPHTYLTTGFHVYKDFQAYMDQKTHNTHALVISTNDALYYLSMLKPPSLIQKKCTYVWVYDYDNELSRIKKCLHAAADDYLNYPIDYELLHLKHIALSRRIDLLNTHYIVEQKPLIDTELFIDTITKQVWLREKALDLTHSEFCIFYALAKNPDHIFTMEYLFHTITGQKSLGDFNALMTHISRLRKKLSRIDPEHKYILTVRNKGYKFNAFKKNDGL